MGRWSSEDGSLEDGGGSFMTCMAKICVVNTSPGACVAGSPRETVKVTCNLREILFSK